MSQYDISRLIEDLVALGLYPPVSASPVDFNNVPYLNGAHLAGTRNRVVNGNFRVNSKNLTSPVTLAAGEFGHDTWYAGSGGCTYEFTPVIGGIEIEITSGTLLQDFFIDNGNYTFSWQGTSQSRSGWNATPSGVYSSSPIGYLVGQGTLTLEFNAGTLGFVQFEPRASTNPNLVITPFEHRMLRLEQMLAGLVPEGIATGPIEVPAGATAGQAVRADEAQWSSPISVPASGSAVDITGIPSGIRELCVTFDSVGIPANANGALQIGPSTGIVSAGYSSLSAAIAGIQAGADPSTTAFGLRTNQLSAFTLTGSAVLKRLGNTNSWTANGLLSGSASSRLVFVSGDVTLTDVMDRIRVNLSTGTFSGGTFYISWRY